LVRFARLSSGTSIASVEDAFPAVEGKTAREKVPIVTLPADAQNRPNLLVEEIAVVLLTVEKRCDS
jgi:hypothetical protein